MTVAHPGPLLAQLEGVDSALLAGSACVCDGRLVLDSLADPAGILGEFRDACRAGGRILTVTGSVFGPARFAVDGLAREPAAGRLELLARPLPEPDGVPG